ncbi:cytochrome P450 protein [Rutstroemia sp. NJR-2017a WRK4]|nr:cytochrome P450 protein [Rutstroemia sp. NJR-2017a WRK4]PQE14752.1 cytochrome P450 protein [Rutstroemia sp. NJR-2017a WRK4]
MTVDGERVWKRYRDMIAPALENPNVLDFAALDVALNTALSKIPQDGETVDMSPIFDELFLDTGLQWLLGQSLSSVSAPPSSINTTQSPPKKKITIQEFYSAFCACQAWMGLRMAFRGLARSIPNKKWKADIQIMHDFIDQQIDIISAQNEGKEVEKWNLETGEEVAQAKPQPQSLLTILINQNATPYEIRSQVLQGMLATQDTSAILLSNALFDLSRHPSLWRRLREEVLGLGENGKHLTEKTLRGMSFLRNVFKETLRLHPIFPNMARTALKDTILPTGGGASGTSPIFVPAGSDVMTNFYSLHRDPRVFGPGIETFDPDRWTRIAPTRWEYMAFGGGPRSCGGQHKALMEASYVVVRLAQRFGRLESRDQREWRGEVRLLARNVNGCEVAFYGEEVVG